MSTPQQVPQFDKADFGNRPSDVCFKCNQPVVGSYYRWNSAMVCASCANILQHDAGSQPEGRFFRALLLGCAGALLGLALYSAVGIITGLEIGYVSLAVGFIIAKAVLMGSGGVGGRKYQIAAVLLTYMAVSMSAVPIALHAMRSKEDSSKTATAAPAAASSSSGKAEPKSSSPVGLFAAIGMLMGIGLASPFLGLTDGAGGVIGLIILFVGMNIAWRMTAGVAKPTFEGPYTV